MQIFRVFFILSVLMLPIHAELTEMEKVELKEKREQKQDEMLFITGLGILAQVVQIFIDPQNIPKVKMHAAKLIQEIVQFAQYAIQEPLLHW